MKGLILYMEYSKRGRACQVACGDVGGCMLGCAWLYSCMLWYSQFLPSGYNCRGWLAGYPLGGSGGGREGESYGRKWLGACGLGQIP